MMLCNDCLHAAICENTTQGNCDWYLSEKELKEKPQGECKTCRYRDPEDKKCDCGGLERQGCIFSVSDDYYCKYYEKGDTK